MFENNEITFKDLEHLSRKQRHDFMNILQIVYGYLQLDRKEDAIAQIIKATNITEFISQLYKLSILGIALTLEKKLTEVSNMGIDISLEVETSYQDEYRHISNEAEIMDKITQITDYILKIDTEILESENIDVDIKIIENSDSLQIIFTNDYKCLVLEYMSRFEWLHEELEVVDNDIVFEFEYKQVKNMQIKDSIYSKLYSNTI